MSKYILVITLVVGVIRDAFTDASNSELSLWIIAGMSTAVAIKYVFEERS